MSGPEGVVGLHILVEKVQKLGNQSWAAQGRFELAIDKHGSLGFFSRSGKRDSNMGVLRFTGAIDDTTHDRHLEVFDAVIAILPNRHLRSEISLNPVGHLLKKSAGCAATPRAGGHLRQKTANSHGLENLLTDLNLFGSVSPGSRSQGDSNGIADPLLKQYG